VQPAIKRHNCRATRCEVKAPIFHAVETKQCVKQNNEGNAGERKRFVEWRKPGKAGRRE